MKWRFIDIKGENYDIWRNSAWLKAKKNMFVLAGEELKIMCSFWHHWTKRGCTWSDALFPNQRVCEGKVFHVGARHLVMF